VLRDAVLALVAAWLARGDASVASGPAGRRDSS
jgi:hypothetical protein